MTRIIGLTGGIGSGKSTMARFFAELGVPVYYADEAAKEVMQTDDMSAQLKAAFGDAIFNNNIVDRKKLAAIVFSDKEKLKTLNSLVHPVVGKHFKVWLQNHRESDFVIREAAILFESGTYKDCDKVITVTAPLEARIERVIKRDGTSREQVVKRIENQWSDEKKVALSDFTIENVDLEIAKADVVKIFKTLKKP